jgi:hypothetical protein
MATQYEKAKQDQGSVATPIDMGGLYNFDPSVNPMVRLGTHKATRAPAAERIVGVSERGIEIQEADGKTHTVSEMYGKSTVKKRVDGKQTYWFVDKSVVPVMDQIDDKGHVAQYLKGDSYEVDEDDKRAVGDVIKMYTDFASSQDPAEKQKFLDTQDRLWRAGLMSKKPNRGNADPLTQKALNDAAIMASTSGRTLDETIDALIAGNPNGPDNKEARQKEFRDIKLTNKESIAEAAKKIAPDLIGSQPGEDQIAKLAANYNAMELSQQNAIYDAADATDPAQGGGVITYKQPDIQTYIQNELRNQNPVASKGMAIGQHLAEFMNLLGGSSASGSTFGGN